MIGKLWLLVVVPTICIGYLPELSPQFDGILQKEAFPFIKTLNKMEAEHYYQFYKDSDEQISFDYVNIGRADWFKKFPEKDVKKEEQELVINDSFLENSVSPVEELVIEYPTASVNTGPRKTTGVIELF
uniref:Uncharacterized protein n=1 Tax=Panagrolaimus superbus TaxID=310955 RepID=A0A914YHA5_9BILA